MIIIAVWKKTLFFHVDRDMIQGVVFYLVMLTGMMVSVVTTENVNGIVKMVIHEVATLVLSIIRVVQLLRILMFLFADIMDPILGMLTHVLQDVMVRM